MINNKIRVKCPICNKARYVLPRKNLGNISICNHCNAGIIGRTVKGFTGMHHTQEYKDNMSKRMKFEFENELRTVPPNFGYERKGKAPWSKGLTKETDERLLEAGRKSSITKKGVPNLKIRGENHYNYKGNLACYAQKHAIINSRLGKPINCYVNKSHTGWIEWTNLYHDYNINNLDDWVSLCRSCHRKYDRNHIPVNGKYFIERIQKRYGSKKANDVLSEIILSLKSMGMPPGHSKSEETIIKMKKAAKLRRKDKLGRFI